MLNRAAWRIACLKLSESGVPFRALKLQAHKLAVSIERDEPKFVAENAATHALASAIRLRNEARHWLTTDTADFRLVCSLAGMEPDSVLDRTRRLARRNWVLDERTKKRIDGWDSVSHRTESRTFRKFR
jgi:hypothetical protein